MELALLAELAWKMSLLLLMLRVEMLTNSDTFVVPPFPALGRMIRDVELSWKRLVVTMPSEVSVLPKLSVIEPDPEMELIDPEEALNVSIELEIASGELIVRLLPPKLSVELVA